MITGMAHTGLIVEDRDRAIKFYSGVLGLELVATLEREGKGLSQVVGYENARTRSAFLRIAGGAIVELIQYVSPEASARGSRERNVLGASHLALNVDDVDQAYRHVMSHGASAVNPPVDVVPGRRCCYFYDPEGNLLEFVQTDQPV